MSNKLSWIIKVVMIVLLLPGQIRSQSLPVGTPVLEDYYRRAQLLGKVDPAVSFTSRPITSASLKLNNVFDPDSTGSISNGRSEGIYTFWGKFGKVQLLPVIWQNQFNTHHPYSLNDGAMIPARGYQTLLSAGIYAKLGPLSFQIRPEVVYAENKPFQGFYPEHPEHIKTAYYSNLNYIDLPERFGDGSYQKMFLGQSNVRLTVGPLSLGVSNENLWWGPGIRNSLMMSSSAPGFAHVTFNTARPVKTFLGSFEWQIVGGRLENSGYAPFDTTLNGSELYVPKRNDWRYINGLVMSYQPRFIKGFFAGITRTFIVFHNDMGNTVKDYLPIITPIDKKSNYGEGESTVAGDQRASAFFRWVWIKEHAEIYTEFIREDHAYNARDFIVDPDHGHGYIFGLKKLLPLKKKDQLIQVQIELTNLAQIKTNPERPVGSLYEFYGGISQGYTNQGQMLGAGIGPGSNMQSVSVSWVKVLKQMGIRFERYVHNYDFYTSVIRDVRANWVDFSASAFGEWDYKNFLFSARVEAIRSYNYQFLYRPEASNPTSFWDPGKDIYNYQGSFSVMYRF